MLTLPPKRRGREQAACWQLLRFAACLTRPDGTSARVPRQPGPVETTHPHRTEPYVRGANPSTGPATGRAPGTRDGCVVGTIPGCACCRGRRSASSCSPPPSWRAGTGRPACVLNQPEAVALICDAMLEAARAGAAYAEVEAAGRAAVEPGEVMDGVRELVAEVRLEVLLGDGTRVIALRDPLGRGTPPDPLGPGALVLRR